MNADEKKCPRCAETIKREALVCKHCGMSFASSNSVSAGDRKPNRVWWLYAIGIVFGLFLISRIGSGDAPAEVANAEIENSFDSGEPINATAASITALYSDYEANEVAAQQKWGGQMLAVTGNVQSIELDLTNDPVVRLSDEGQDLNAYFDKDDGGQATSELKKGQRVTLVCARVGEVLGTPSISQCKVADEVHEFGPVKNGPSL